MPRTLKENQSQSWWGHPQWYSLRAKFALGYSLVALLAVLVITLAAITAVSINLSNYQRNQLSTQAHVQASQLGQRYTADQDQLPLAALDMGPGGGLIFLRRDFWIIDTNQQPILSAEHERVEFSAQDIDQIQAALVQALSGQEVQGAFPDQGSFLLGVALSHRPFIALPIRAGGQASGQVVGALAEVSPSPGPGAATLPEIDAAVHVLLWTVLGVAIFVALLGALLSRSVTQPVAHLTRAAARLAAGDYHQRVQVQTKDELGRLAGVFNEMAAALEADVGELRRQEALRRELVANVSHDLATPLTAIQGFTEALMDGVIQDDRQREETLSLISKEVARLRRLVADLSHLARVESPSLRLDLAPLHLWTLVDETLAMIQPECEAKEVRVENQVSPALPLVSADGDKLTEVLLNLLDNALRYTPSGGSISVSAEAWESWVCLWVQDTGIGMATEEVSRVFDRFYRADTSRSAATGGSGLGLAIVKAIIEAHGGTVGATSAPDQGTCIWFTLAQDRAQLADAAPTGPAVIPVPSSGHSGTGEWKHSRITGKRRALSRR